MTAAGAATGWFEGAAPMVEVLAGTLGVGTGFAAGDGVLTTGPLVVFCLGGEAADDDCAGELLAAGAADPCVVAEPNTEALTTSFFSEREEPKTERLAVVGTEMVCGAAKIDVCDSLILERDIMF